MSTKMISVQFSDEHECQIPLADLLAVCAVGSGYAIPLPVASKETFDHFKCFVNKQKPGTRNPAWDYTISEWENDFIHHFRDKNQLNYLAAVAQFTKQQTLERLCDMRVSALTFDAWGEEDDLGGDDEEYDDYDCDNLVMKKSPSPDTLPKDEDDFWDNYGREDDELYGEDRESPSPDTLPKDEGEYWQNYNSENDEFYGEDRDSPSP